MGGTGHKFNLDHLDRLNDPEREKSLDPEALWNAFGARDPKVVIDVGAGTGFFAIRFVPKVADGGKIYACDVSDTMIEWMMSRLSAEQLRIIVPLKMAESAIGLPDGLADLVYMINVHHELAEPGRLLEEAVRLMKRDAAIGIVDWKKEPMEHGPPLDHRVEPEVIIRQMIDAGLRDVRKLDILPFHSLLVARK